jgi:hypothetical protein
MPNLYSMIILNVTTDLYLMYIPLPVSTFEGVINHCINTDKRM